MYFCNILLFCDYYFAQYTGILMSIRQNARLTVKVSARTVVRP